MAQHLQYSSSHLHHKLMNVVVKEMAYAMIGRHIQAAVESGAYESLQQFVEQAIQMHVSETSGWLAIAMKSRNKSSTATLRRNAAN